MTPKKTKATFSRLFKKWGRSHFTCPSLTYVNTPMNAVPFKTLHRNFKCICFDGSLFANPYIVTHSMHPRNILNYHDIFFSYCSCLMYTQGCMYLLGLKMLILRTAATYCSQHHLHVITIVAVY